MSNAKTNPSGVARYERNPRNKATQPDVAGTESAACQIVHGIRDFDETKPNNAQSTRIFFFIPSKI
jgi:hypothetical protein